jgi:hypothetical protein
MKILGTECWRILMPNKIQPRAVRELQEVVRWMAFCTFRELEPLERQAQREREPE